MGRACKVCRHPARNEIDRALIGGESSRSIGEKYGLDHTVVHRHYKNHVPAAIQAAAKAAGASPKGLLDAAARELLTADPTKVGAQFYFDAARIFSSLEEVAADAKRIMEKAEKAKQYGAAVASLSPRLRGIELLLTAFIRWLEGQRAREKAPSVVIVALVDDIAKHPKWLELKRSILGILGDLPEPRGKVRRYLEEVEGERQKYSAAGDEPVDVEEAIERERIRLGMTDEEESVDGE